MAETGYRGRFLWFDLMTISTKEAVAFYSKIAGWATELWQEDYTMWTNQGEPLGGVMDLPEGVRAAGAPPHWISHIGTPNVDATCDKVVELGGEVLRPPEDIPTVGRFAVLKDPHGAVFSGFTSSSSAPGHEGPPKTGEFSWHELATTDHASAFDFYHNLFDWEKMEPMDMGEMGTYQIFGRKGLPLGGMFNKTAEMPGPPNWLYYILVSNVETVAEEVKRLGGQVLNGPMDVPGGDKIAQCMDPHGALFAIHSKA